MVQNLAFLDLGTPELIVILAIVLLLFGSKKLPELSRSIGESVKELRKAASSTTELKNEAKTHVAEVKADLSGTNDTVN